MFNSLTLTHKKCKKKLPVLMLRSLATYFQDYVFNSRIKFKLINLKLN